MGSQQWHGGQDPGHHAQPPLKTTLLLQSAAQHFELKDFQSWMGGVARSSTASHTKNKHKEPLELGLTLGTHKD